MRLNKKGSLELSVNAIVILIIALSIMGLVLGFGVSKFSDLSSRITITEETPDPTPSNPLQIPGGKNSLTLNKKTSTLLDAKVYNSRATDITIKADAVTDDSTQTSVDCGKFTSYGSCYPYSYGGKVCDWISNECVNDQDASCDKIKTTSNQKCSAIGCGNSDGTECTEPSTSGSTESQETSLKCAPNNDGIQLGVLETTVAAGTVESVPVTITVAKNAVIGDFACRLSLGGISKTLRIKVE